MCLMSFKRCHSFGCECITVIQHHTEQFTVHLSFYQKSEIITYFNSTNVDSKQPGVKSWEAAHHQQELQTEAEQWELWGRTFNFKYIKNHWQVEPTERAPQTKCFSFCCSWSRTSECCVTHLYLPTSVQLPSWPAAVIISLWSYDYITSVVAGWD